MLPDYSTVQTEAKKLIFSDTLNPSVLLLVILRSLIDTKIKIKLKSQSFVAEETVLENIRSDSNTGVLFSFKEN